VAVAERRRRLLHAEEWRALERAHGFWRLVDAGYVSVRRLGADRYEIAGHKHVGRALVGDLEIRVDEKVPGTLLALLAAATGAELRILEAQAPATQFDVVSRHLMSEFTQAAARYVAGRRRPRYAYREAQGPVLAGALDMARTMRLHATGRLGHFAFGQGSVVRDEPLDRLVLAGLESLDRAAEALQLAPRTLYDARWLAGALAEVRDRAFLLMTQEALLSVADEVERAADRLPDDVDLARLAVVALLHRGFEPLSPQVDEVPRAWFVDLETLFESAVRTTMRQLLGAALVDRGEGFSRRMFTGGADASRTHPDLVVHRGPDVLAVGDVKYKALAAGLGEEGGAGAGATPRGQGKEGRPDLYQVLVHAASLDAGKAFLVYAGDGFACRYPGVAATGAETWIAQVRPSELAADLAAMLEKLALAA
jgi:McrBC 5-methylcytosine restriction system component